MSWKTENQHILPYTGSADGLETWIDVDLGRNSWRANNLHEQICAATRGIAYACSKIYEKQAV